MALVLSFDADRGMVEHQGASVRLTGQQGRLFSALARNAGHLVSLDRLVYEIWPSADHQPDGAKDTIRTHVSRVRKALDRIGAAECIVPTYSRGYILEAQVEMSKFPVRSLDSRQTQDLELAFSVLEQHGHETLADRCRSALGME